MSRDDKGFLGRWSERKRSAVDDTGEDPAAAEPIAEVEEEKTDEEWLEELGLPEPETLDKGDDFTRFMASAVPARLRNRALRRLWLTNPLLANLDEMVDYGEDFTDAATVVENLKTAYDVQRGWLPEEVDEPEEGAEPPDAASDDVETANDEDAEEPAEQEAVAEDPAEPVSVEEPVAAAADPLPDMADAPAFADPPPARTRRMRFRVG